MSVKEKSSGYKKGLPKKLPSSLDVPALKDMVQDLWKNYPSTADDMLTVAADSLGISKAILEGIGSGSYADDGTLLGQKTEGKDTRQRDPNVLGGNRQPPTGQGTPDYSNTKTQKGHPSKYDAASLAARTGVSTEKAQEFIDAIHGGSIGGFTWGWDGVIRAYQNGATRAQILSMHHTKETIQNKFGGDENAYFAALRRKASGCEELIDRSPKWNGKELTRGFHGLDNATIDALTNTDPNTLINLNRGTASWTTSVSVARSFASSSYGFIAHVSGERRGTSIKAGSHYKGESEVLCSRREAFRCTRWEKHSDGYIHAYYEVVDTDYDWGGSS